MTYLAETTQLFEQGSRAIALVRWRRAAARVAELWADYREAERCIGPVAFCAYMAALDAEEAAANELRNLTYPALAEAA